MTDFFNGVDQTSNVSNAAPTDQAGNAENTTHQAALIGEGKRYRDILTADKALLEKEEYIKKLESENASFRGTITKFSTMEEAIKRLEAKPQTANSEQPTSAPVANNANVALDPNKIEQMVEAKVSEIEKNRQAEANRLRVANQLTKVYGDAQKANEIIIQKAQELGVDPDYIRKQAREAPDIVLRLLIPEGKMPKTDGIVPGGILPQATPNLGSFNPIKDPVVNQLLERNVDGRGFKIKTENVKSWEQQMAAKLGIKHTV